MNAFKPQLTVEEETLRGKLLADVLGLKRDLPDYPDRWRTKWGNKTDLGLFRIIERIVIDGE